MLLLITVLATAAPVYDPALAVGELLTVPYWGLGEEFFLLNHLPGVTGYGWKWHGCYASYCGGLERNNDTFLLRECTSGRTALWEHLCCYYHWKIQPVSTLHLASLICTNKTNPESKTVVGGQNNDVKIRQTALSSSRNVSKSDLALDS